MNDRPSMTELTAFATIARKGSFRAAADELNLSASTLSHLVRGLEQQLGLRLFNRTTRSVAPTAAGAELYANLTPVLSALDQALADVTQRRVQPSGLLRINASDNAARLLLRTVVYQFVERFPEVHVDLVTEGRLVDIVAEGFDAGVRLSEAVPKDMIAVPFGGNARFLPVASPAYLAKWGTPLTPEDLKGHRCIRFRMPSGKIYRWEFEHHGQELKLDVEGPLTLDDMRLMVDAALEGLGIAFVSFDTVQEVIEEGLLVALLPQWTPSFAGFCLYYPSHRLVPPSLRAFVDFLRATPN